MRFSSLVREVIADPGYAMAEIAESRAWRRGLALAAGLTLFSGLADLANPKRRALLEDPGLAPAFRAVFSFLLSPWWLVPYAALVFPALLALSTAIYFACGRVLDGRGSFAALLATQSFALVPLVFLIPINFVFDQMRVPLCGGIAGILTCVWMLCLSGIGIRESLGLSTARAVATLLLPNLLLVLPAACLLLGLAIGFSTATQIAAIATPTRFQALQPTWPTPTPTPTKVAITPFPTRPPQGSPTVVFPAPITGQPQVRKVALTANDLVFDPHSGLLYASVPGAITHVGNSIVPIDPQTGTLGQAIYVGSEPTRLALSDDGHYLYVGLDGASAIRRVDLWAGRADLQFPLDAERPVGVLVAASIAVVPGQQGAIAVARTTARGAPINGGVAVYLDGVQLPATAPSYYDGNAIAFCDRVDLLYAYDDGAPANGFRTLLVGVQGVRESHAVRGVLRAQSRALVCLDGRLYTTAGEVVEIAASRLVGTFAEVEALSVYPDPNGQTFFLGQTGIPGQERYRLIAGDQRTLRWNWSFDLPSIPDGRASGMIAREPGSLVRWGSDGLAFRAGAGQIWLVRAPQVADPRALPPTVTPSTHPTPPTPTRP